jgi:hypothetical protein
MVAWVGARCEVGRLEALYSAMMGLRAESTHTGRIA